MDSTDWERVQEIFIAAAELPAGDREAFLAESCAGDDALLAEVRSLLDASELTHGAMEALGGVSQPEAPRVAGDTPRVAVDEPGQRIGPYRLVRELGRGGMGIVWLAEQLEPIQRQVALKIIKRGMDTAEVVARFESERQALAVMDHPSIAKVYAAGATPDGRPYFAMELVDGPSISEYCDEHRLTTRDRLKLFAQVCRATQHAHQKGVIHRDLKPSNVLVSVQDGVPVPKVIDFGIAKATDARFGDRAQVTRIDQVIGTPTYMSPEQADLDGRDIDTRTDIYSLGVVLYELLVGAPPIDLGRVAVVAMSHAIRSASVPRPSAKATSLGASLTAIAECRRTSPEALKRDLKDDLDWIILKAIDKDRSRRYDTASSFADDIERRLLNEPVVARPPSASYRLQKFVRRHRVAVAGTLAAVLAVLAFGVNARAQAERVRVERDKALNVSSFMEELFRGADPMAGRTERRDTLRLREFLAEGAQKVETDLADEPEVQAHMLNIIGSVFRNWGQYDAAAPLLEEALEIRTALHEPTHPDVLHAQESLGLLRFDQASFQEAAERLTTVIDARRTSPDATPRDLARALQGLGNVHQSQGEFERAADLYREALNALLSDPDVEPLVVAQAQSNLGAALYRLAQYEESEALQRAALDTDREHLGSDHPRVATHLNNLAFLLEDTGRSDEAEPLYRDALQIRRVRLGPAHPLLASSINNLAGLLLNAEEYDEAHLLFAESLEMRRELLGPDHPNVGVATANMASALTRMDRLDEAEQHYLDATRILVESLGPDHPAVATVTGNHAAFQHTRGEHEIAIPLFRRALAIRRDKLAAGHFLTASLLSDMGQCLGEMGEFAEAEAALLEARQTLEPLQDAQTRRWTTVHERLAELYESWGRPDQAERFRSTLTAS